MANFRNFLFVSLAFFSLCRTNYSHNSLKGFAQTFQTNLNRGIAMKTLMCNENPREHPRQCGCSSTPDKTEAKPHGWWEWRRSHGVPARAGANCTDGEKCFRVSHEGFENQLGDAILNTQNCMFASPRE